MIGPALITGVVVSLAASNAYGEPAHKPDQTDESQPAPATDAAATHLAGDFNLNGEIDLEDVTACALAWRDRDAYFEAYPLADEESLNKVGDFTGDGLFDTQDIDSYKTFIVAELTAQQQASEKDGADPARREAEEATIFKPTSTVVWTNDPLPEVAELEDAEPSIEDIVETEAPPVTDLVVDPSFTKLPPARSSKSEGSGGQVIRSAGNGGGGGGGGGFSLGGGGGGAAAAGGGGSSGSGGGASVIGGGTSNIIVARGGSTGSGSNAGTYSPGTTGGQAKVELRNPNAAVAPIEHEANFRGEAALFGYAPFYDPNPIAFDPDNKPYIRVAGRVQTQGPNGEWVEHDIDDSIRRYYQTQRINRNFIILGGQFIDQRITFDSRGDAYTIARVASGKNHWRYLMHSRDNCVTWDAYLLPLVDHIRIEFNDGHNTLDQPPVLLLLEGKTLSMIMPRRNANGTIAVPDPVTVSTDSLLVPNHSGAANSAISVGGQVFVVYPLASQYQSLDGTSQFVMAFDRDTGAVTTPQTFLGNVGEGVPDDHNRPAITADSQGHLHAVLGGHHNDLYYLKSDAPLDASSWSTPVTIGKTVQQGLNRGGHTYNSLLCDANDQLHVVTRWAGDYIYKFHLSYNTGDAETGTWATQKPLVSPFRTHYSVWYHHLSMDREGRLFLNYLYYGNQLNAEHLAAYKQIWPEDGVPDSARPYPAQERIEEIKPHDPAILFTDNAGEDWQLATSPDLFTED